MSSNEQLLQQIDDLVASKTFGLDALEGIKIIKDSLKRTLSDLEATKGMLDLKRQETCDLRDELARKQQRIEELQDQVKSNDELAKKGQEAIYAADKHKAVAEAWQNAMQTVFKPNAVRETVARSVPVAVPMNSNGYMGNVQVHPAGETVTREDA